jgi:hypothetical protein
VIGSSYAHPSPAASLPTSGTLGKCRWVAVQTRVAPRCGTVYGSRRTSVHPFLNDTSGTDLNKFSRLEQLVWKQFRQSAAQAKGGKKYFTFAGFKANIDASPPTKARATKQYPWRGCVSEDWIKDTDCKIEFPQVDESVNVLKIYVPDSFFQDEHDALWLGKVDDGFLLDG